MNVEPGRHADAASAWTRATAILDQVLAATAEDQPALIARLCGDDEALHREVSALVEADRAGSGILEERADLFAAPYVAAMSGGETDRPAADDKDSSGDRVSAYRLIRRIGGGGMGTVYLAERDDGQFEQRVAVKLIKPGMDSDDIIERFMRERQILARLQHPNIARLLDGGVTADGLPFFVMEYVEGTPITQFCDQQQLGVHARLELLDHVCRAIEYAHRNLIIHRDLKPSNVLVDHHGTVKLLDFGIAKLLANDEGPSTGTADQRVFLTPEYASPELLRGEPVITSSDVYQLGVLLFELLTGRRPYAVDRSRPLDTLRLLAGEAPPRPSSTFSARWNDPADLGARSASRGTTPTGLRRMLSGDLDAVVAKALRAEPARRYDSAGALADDLRRHLTGRPVLARDEGLAYRARKFVGRHAAAVAGVAATVLLLTLATAYYTLRIRAERDTARLEATKALQSATMLERVFATWNPTAANRDTLSPRDVLRIAEVSAGMGGSGQVSETAGDREVRAAMLSLLGGLHTRLADYDRSLQLLQRAQQVQEQGSTDRPTDLAATLTRQGQLFEMTGRFADGERALRRAIDILDREAPGSAEAFQARLTLASLLQRAQRHDEAIVLCQEVLDHYRARTGAPEAQWVTAWTRVELGDLLTQQGRTAEAIAVLEQARDDHHRLFGGLHGLTFRATLSAAHAYRDHGDLAQSGLRYREALQQSRTLFGDEDARTTDVQWLFAMLLERRGEFGEAEALMTRTRDWWERHGRPAGQTQMAWMSGLASLRLVRGDPTGALPMLEDALAQMRNMFGTSPDEGDMLNRIAYIRVARGDARATEAYRAAVSFHHRRDPAAPLFATDGIDYLAWAMRRMGDTAEAERTYRQALDVFTGRVIKGHPSLVRSLIGLGETLQDLGRADEAASMLEEGLQQARLRSDLNAELIRAAETARSRDRSQRSPSAAAPQLKPIP